MIEDILINKVAQSGIVTLDLEKFLPKGENILIDIKDQLYMGMVLKEKDFREFIKSNDWSVYANKNVAIICSADAIVPTWAYMLIATKLNNIASFILFGDLKTLETILFQKELQKINPNDFEDKRVVVKGCSNIPVPESAYVEITRLLTPVVKSLMFGEPCSTVPIYKKA